MKKTFKIKIVDISETKRFEEWFEERVKNQDITKDAPKPGKSP